MENTTHYSKNVGASGRCRPEHCSKAHIDLYFVTSPDVGRLPAQEALLRLMQRGGCRGAEDAGKACASFAFFAAGELVRRFVELEGRAAQSQIVSLFPDQDAKDRCMYLWDALTVFIRNGLMNAEDFNRDDLDAFYLRMLETFVGAETYESRAKIIRSFSTIAGAGKGDFLTDMFWSCLDDFRAWCEAAADVFKDQFPAVLRSMIEGLIDTWSQVLSGHAKNAHAVFKVIESAPHLLKLLAADSAFLKGTTFLVWHRMMMKFKRDLDSDGFPHVAGSYKGLKEYMRKTRDALSDVRTSQLTQGEFKREIDELFPVLRGEEKAPERHIPGGRPIPCRITIPGGRQSDGLILDIGVVRHLGLRLRCRDLPVHFETGDREVGTPTHEWVCGFQLRSVPVEQAESVASAAIVDLNINFEPTQDYQGFGGRFGIVRAWSNQQGLEFAVVADETVRIPKSFHDFVEAHLPLGRHRPVTQEA